MVGQFPARVKIRIGCLNLALSGAQKCAGMLHHPSIHYWVLLKKLSILSIDTWGENSFFHPLLIQEKFASGAFGAHCPHFPANFQGGGGGWGGVGVKGPLPASPPWTDGSCVRKLGQSPPKTLYPNCTLKQEAQITRAKCMVVSSQTDP